ncbi:MAG: DEAD/DEAH box helicase [Desulfobulbaceae bacterium]|uniref:DEAD-box ATP-dependent RNA helicase RhpA n=1 Tax=Candidatus Desulfatifera sulfidica TaxID=2841691 RepID=A0A8J6NAC7_9BACT|nr:DEAD/DEAH box helicase [Candidatus Desulfatifera sulfidica]
MSFTAFNFHPQIQTALDNSGYEAPTPIQNQAIPPVLAGRDILGLAQTGTGKTAAFILPLLQRLHAGPKGKIRALIIAPTRELAEQIHTYIGKMAKHTHMRSMVIYGGVSKHSQISNIRRGADIVVACPGRLLDLVNDRAINLSAVEMLILDEADHMFDHGFLPDIRRILKTLPRKRQTMVFSATMPKEIRSLAEDILTHPTTVQINHTQPTASISHAFYKVEQRDKAKLLRKILTEKDITTAIVFTRTKHKAKNLGLQLQKAGFKATSMQGNLSQPKRQEALDGFKNGTYNIMVATDIAARGIDVSGISHVINFDMPATAETYTHRTGRTGRASCTGEAFTFTAADDYKMIKALEQSLGQNLVFQTIAGFQSTPQVSENKTTAQNPTARIATKARSARGKKKSQRNQPEIFNLGLSTRA